MKVLKSGFDVNAWKHQFQCYWCKSELEICASDLEYSGERGNWAESGWERYEVQCPLCSTTNTIENELIPILVGIYAEKRTKGWG